MKIEIIGVSKELETVVKKKIIEGLKPSEATECYHCGLEIDDVDDCGSDIDGNLYCNDCSDELFTHGPFFDWSDRD